MTNSISPTVIPANAGIHKESKERRSPALFLDRDGVINVDHGYVHKIEDFEFIDGIFELCRAAQEKGYKIVVITNQAGIARGYYTEEDFRKLTDWMKDQFEANDITINAVYFSPYHPEHGIGKYKLDSDCRKPKPGMILRAKDELNLQIDRSVLIGDKESDLQAGKSAGITENFLFISNLGKKYISTKKISASTCSSLLEVSRLLTDYRA